ncbi:MAG: glycosyltransferase [Bacteroidota bacterium]
MISILIPIFNFDVRHLVADLTDQCKAAGQPFEIICFDDGSTAGYKEKNRQIINLQVVYKEMRENCGRSAIRNALGQAAKYPYLLFMDCDSKVVKSDYIKTYLEKLSPGTLLYGGRSYNEQPPTDPDLFFHWKYGIMREQKNAAERSKSPWHSFMTNNFLIPKKVFEKINFDESLKQYGHEDTLFGLELAREKINIVHLDNPLEHLGLEPTDIFLNKTKKGVANLYYLHRRETLIDTKLLRYFIRINKWKLTGPVSKLFNFLKPYLIKNIKSNHPNLKIFDFYKLGHLCGIAT